MLSVQIEKLIKSTSDNIKQWETLFNLASHSHYSALIKECALDDARIQPRSAPLAKLGRIA